jgi:hypothetical protein
MPQNLPRRLLKGMGMTIPKIIHYCWFGPAPMPDIAHQCIESWRRVCPDYDIQKWDEENFDVEAHVYSASAYRRKQYSKVSNFVRAYALSTVGGVYVDTDVELKASLDPFLRHPAFSGFETSGLPFTALWGSQANHPWPKAVLAGYQREIEEDELTNTELTSRLLTERFGIIPNEDRYQEGRDGIVIYPSSRFCLDLPENTATHHFTGTWSPEVKRYKEVIHARYHRHQLLTSGGYGSDAELLRDILRDLGVARSVRALVGVSRLVSASLGRRVGRRIRGRERLAE